MSDKSKLESAAKHSSDTLNLIIDHAHLTDRDYLMALERTEARDAALVSATRPERYEQELAKAQARIADALDDNAAQLQGLREQHALDRREVRTEAELAGKRAALDELEAAACRIADDCSFGRPTFQEALYAVWKQTYAKYAAPETETT